MEKLIFIEALEEADFFYNNMKEKDKYLVICLNPNIQNYFKKKNISILNSSDFTDKIFYKNFMEKSEEINKKIKKYLFSTKNSYLPEFYLSSWFYYSMFIWRHFIWNIELIDCCFKKYKCDKVIGFYYKEKRKKSPWIEDDQLYLGEIIKKYCEINSIKCELLTTEPIVKKKNDQSWLSAKFKKFLKLFFRISFLKITKNFSKNKLIFVPNDNENIKELCLQLQKKIDLKVISYTSPLNLNILFKNLIGVLGLTKIINKKKNFKNSQYDFYLPISYLCNTKGENQLYKDFNKLIIDFFEQSDKKLFEYKNISFFEPLFNKIKFDVHDEMKKLFQKSEVISQYLKNLSPDLLISNVNFAENAAAGYYSEKYNVPSILISHGSHILHYEKYSKSEHEIMKNNILVGKHQFLGVQSPLAEELIKKDNYVKNDVLRIKPFLWGKKIKKKEKNNDFVVLHASTFKNRHTRFHIYETSDEYLKSVKQLCDVISLHKNIKLIIKIRSDYFEMTKETLISLLSPIPENITIESERNFLEILEETNLVVSFSSTTIEEALVNNVPVLLYGGNNRYCHIPLKSFEQEVEIIKPINFVDNNEKLVKYFKILSSNINNFSIDEKEFNKYKFSTDLELNDINDWVTNRFTK